jgi:choline kinase
MIKTFVQNNYPSLNITFVFNDVYDSTNNIYSLWLVKKYLQGADILLMDSDIIFDRRIVTQLLASGKGNFLVVRSDQRFTEEEMKVIINEENIIKQISKGIDPNIADGESIGIEKFESGFLHILFDKLYQRVVINGRTNDFYEAAFQDVIEDGQKIFALDVGNYKCIEVDTAEDIEHAERLIAKYIDAN